MESVHEWDAVGDESLVAAALDGSPDARAEIYRRYADRVHTMCVHMLSDRDEAADVCGQVFLTAFDRLGQLRDATRLRAWIFSITRHEVYRRTRRRRRIELIGEVERMDQLHTDQLLHTGDEADEDVTGAAELVAVVRAAADGLDDKDRMVLELQLQELGGDEMAEALGTSTSTAYQQVHRMKERFERSLGALLIARTGRADCDELDELLDGWDGHFSVLWRKRVARHVDRCEVCEGRRGAVPATLFGGAGAAAVLATAGPAGASTEFPAPDAVRLRVLGGTGAATPSAGIPTAGPVARRRGGRTSLLVGGAVAAVLLLLALLSGLGVLGGTDGDELVSDGTSTSTTSTSTTSTTSTSTSTTVAEVVPTPGATLPVSPTVSTVAPPVVAPPGPGAGDVPDGGGVVLPPATPPPSPGPTVAPPSVWIVASPAAVHHPTPGFDSCGASTPFEAEASAGSVHLRWRTATREGRLDLERVVPGGSRWRGVLELPADVVGPVTVEALATVPGATGISADLGLDVVACPTPG